MKLGATIGELEARASTLAAKFPELLVEAHHVAQTVSHGIHGRRRSGPGETFWQFRHFEHSDAAATIDWRRSASSDHLYVREREWEAAHSVWIWVDTSPSMGYRSHLARCSKAERAIILALALGDLLARGGEKVGLLGRRLWSGRRATQRLAEAIVQELTFDEPAPSGPPNVEVSRFSECVLIGDFLEPMEDLAPRLERMAGQGVGGHLVQVLDPAEETLPYEGHTQFVASEGDEEVTTGRAESLRQRYMKRMSRHRQSLMELAERLHWSYLVHHSDRPAEQALLALHNRLAGNENDYRYRTVSGISEFGGGKGAARS